MGELSEAKIERLSTKTTTDGRTKIRHSKINRMSKEVLKKNQKM